MKVIFAALLLAFIIGGTNSCEKVTAEELSDWYQYVRDYAEQHSLTGMGIKEDGTFEGRKTPGEIVPVDFQLPPRILAEMQRRQARFLEKRSNKSPEPRERESIEPQGCNDSEVTDEELSHWYQYVQDYGDKHSLRAMRYREDGTFEGKMTSGEVLPIDLELPPRILEEMQRRQALIMPELERSALELEKSVLAQVEYFREHRSFEPKSCGQ
ncbi:hypothetical protein PSEUBRA_000229 [Kalmanozyma brasiliensis GHG001]|nr:uncharacterized protein PSEUBRA_000229 [Kalmanozyma brasiliensis GHG001]EST09839.2 hypothetical protein PSEUBRA_000229 [Kalmanozyma brasiliensis GHG001]